VNYTATFDTPSFGGNQPVLNGGRVVTLTATGGDACQGQAGAPAITAYTADSVYNMRHENSETVYGGGTGNVITPHAGAGFMFQKLDVALNYGNTCVNPTSPNDKPRAVLYHPMSQFSTATYVLYPWDEIIFYHASIFVPAGLEAENCSTNDLDHRETSMNEWSVQASGSSGNFLTFKMATETDGDSVPSFFVEFSIDPANAVHNSNHYRAWLGPVERGEWTEVVLKFRVNPYSTSTVVAGTFGATYGANRGLFEVYRTNPADRTGSLIKVYDLASDTAWTTAGVATANAAGVPADLRDQFGLAIPGAYPGATSDIRMYKHAWGTDRSCPPEQSTVSSGVYQLGIDEVYVGTEETDGTTCADVTVNRVSCVAQ
jgi:hypothetical protein